jgi:hypothetical protein
MATTTTNYKICKPGSRWLDNNPGCGVAEIVAEALDNVDAAFSSGGQFRTISVLISSAQLLAMKAVPIELVPAMPGFVIKPSDAAIQYIPVSVDYALGDATSLYIGSAVNPTDTTNVIPPIPAAILAGTGGPGNTISFFPPAIPVAVPQSWFENQAIVLAHNGSAELTLGDGTARVTLSCMLLPV